MEVATGALGALIPKFAWLLRDEYSLHKNVKKDIGFLSQELERMHAALRIVGEVPREQLNELVKIWARDVRELSYDMEDIVDTFLVCVQRPEPPSKRTTQRLFKKMTRKVTKALACRGIGQEIKGIKESLKEVAERRDRYNVDTIEPAKTLSDPRIAALYTKLSDLVGIEEAKEELVTMLTRVDDMSTQELRIISIVGFGGLGKTTLAKAVYDELKMQFNCTAFVSVSQNPDTNKLLKDILYELDKNRYENIHSTMLDERNLIDRIREFLQNKRYFIVIDDIWSTEPWNVIRCALVENNMRSQVITTTRIFGVAKKVGDYCYNLKPLTPHNSKILFCRRIFGCEDKMPEQYSQVSEKILNKCGGVPLAIITLSGLLANKLGNIREWHQLCDSIGSGIGSNLDVENMRKVLSLSYYDLPSHLKTCLLYLSIFPEDCDFRRDWLIWRWIAEDFVQHGEGGESLYEIGGRYFSELVNRCLIQPRRYHFANGVVEPFSCRIHDMVHDLICSLSKEENFVTTGLDDSNQKTPSLGSKIHRLSLRDTTCPPENMSKLNTSRLRSLIFFRPAIINPTMLSHPFCNLLRVLDLEDCENICGHPNLRFIGNMFHLRYLGLPRRAYTDELLVEIGKLQFLQRLDIHGAHLINGVPSSILGLRQLMSISVSRDHRLPAGFRNLTSLEVLRSVRVDSGQIAEELGHLTQLRELKVYLGTDKAARSDDESVHAVLVGSLGKLLRLQTLELFANCSGQLEGSVEAPLGNLRNVTIYRTSWLPTWINRASLPLLCHLDIAVYQVRRQDIQVLGMLQALRSLLILSMEVPDTQVMERSMVGAEAFPCLVTCFMHGFPVVPSIFPQGAMPRLERCNFLICLEAFTGGGFTVDNDLHLGHLPSLKEVSVALVAEDKAVIEEVATKVEDKLRDEVDVHPNHPSIYIERL